MSLQVWALPQISRLLPLDEDSLKQIIAYTDTLGNAEAAEHLKNLLGDSPQALEFISTFNSRRGPPPAQKFRSSSNQNASQSEVPRSQPRPKKKKAPLNTPAPRQVDSIGDTSGGYIKKREEQDYVSGRNRNRKEPPLANTLALQSNTDAKQLPIPAQGIDVPRASQPKLPPSAAGSLISDAMPSRSSSPSTRPKTKINVAGGTSMRGQSSTLNDLDSAIRALESSTNPSLMSKQDEAKRRCNCMAQRHELLSAAPNCMKCGKIICAKEGLGPCTFCGSPILSHSDLQAMVHILVEERGKERQDAHNASHRRADIAKASKTFASSSNLSTPGNNTPSAQSSDNEAEVEQLARAKMHRDKLLKFQSDNTRRTRIHDEAADFETPDAGLSMWATPQERALQLKRQQKVLREQEWSSKQDYEKRQMVVSIDVVGGKAVRKMQAVERQEEPEPDTEGDEESYERPAEQKKGGVFSRNPLLGSLVRPVIKSDDKGKTAERQKRSTWRRVQDDNDDNEQWILDGGAYGGMVDGRVLGAEEHGSG